MYQGSKAQSLFEMTSSRRPSCSEPNAPLRPTVASPCQKGLLALSVLPSSELKRWLRAKVALRPLPRSSLPLNLRWLRLIGPTFQCLPASL